MSDTPDADDTSLESTDTAGEGRPDAAEAAIEAAKEAVGPDDPAATQSPTDAQVEGQQG